MANLYRIVLCVLALLCSSVPLDASATVTKSGGGRVDVYKWRELYGACVRDSAAATCTCMAVNYAVNDYTLQGSNTGTCYGRYVPGPNWAIAWTINRYLDGTIQLPPACPQNSVEAGGLCYCTDGFKDASDGASCVSDSNAAKCAAAAGGVDNSYTRTYAASATSQACVGVGPNSDCSIEIKWDSTYSVNGVKGNSGIGKYTGKTCSSTTTTNAQAAAANVPPTTVPPLPAPGEPGGPAPNPCPSGTYPGSVNGVSVCIPPSSTEPVSTTSTTTTSNPNDPAAPVTSTTKDTTCVAATCTTTTTTTTTPSNSGTPGEPVTTTTKTEEAKEDFCTKNPKSTQCLVGLFGGSCSAGFACEGDAVQCAISREIHTRNCQTLQPDTDTNSIFNKAVAGQDPADLTAAKTAAAANAVSVGTFNQTGFSWPRACPADPVITLSWYSAESLTLPFSRLCGPFGLMADAAVAITALGCLLFVLRGSAA